jgi:(R,R)-butanediol dehydrogenase/meso-butanediol dehydrogenase/diacetyl reductase
MDICGPDGTTSLFFCKLLPNSRRFDRLWTMKAAYYGGSRQIEIRQCLPVAPGPGQVRVRVSHCGICGTDLHVYLGDLDHRIRLPEVIGHEGSGTIAELGPGVEGFSVGDPVVVMPIISCGQCPACHAGHYHVCHQLKVIGIEAPGAMQSSWTVPANLLFHLPPSLDLVQAALIEPVAVACHDIRMGEFQHGEYCVVLGGGPIGALIALVAKHKGARVLLTEINPFRIDMLRRLGLEVVDPRQPGWVERVMDETHGAGADIVFEVTGVPAGADMMTKVAKVRGRIVIVGVFAKPAPVDIYKIFARELRLIGARVYQREDFAEAIEIVASGAIPGPELITNIMPLEELRLGLDQMATGGDVMKILIDCQS